MSKVYHLTVCFLSLLALACGGSSATGLLAIRAQGVFALVSVDGQPISADNADTIFVRADSTYTWKTHMPVGGNVTAPYDAIATGTWSLTADTLALLDSRRPDNPFYWPLNTDYGTLSGSTLTFANQRLLAGVRAYLRG